MNLLIRNQVGINNITRKSSYEQVLLIVIEELSELIQACSKELRRISVDKTLRTDDNKIRTALIEEIADCMVVIPQLKYKLDINDIELNSIITKKVERTLSKIEKLT